MNDQLAHHERPFQLCEHAPRGLERVVAGRLIHHYCNCEATDAGRQRDNAPANSADVSG
jgi:hypothetical protein